MPLAGLFVVLAFVSCGSNGADSDQTDGGDTSRPETASAPNVPASYQLTKPYPNVPYPETATLEFDTFEFCGGKPKPECVVMDSGKPNRVIKLSVPNMTLDELDAWYTKYLPERDVSGWSYCPGESTMSQGTSVRSYFKRVPSPLNKYADDHDFSVTTRNIALERTYDAETGEFGPTQMPGIILKFNSDLVCTSEVPRQGDASTDSSLPGPGVKVVVGQTAYVVNQAGSISQLPCGFGRDSVDPEGRFILVDLDIINEGPSPIAISEDTGFLIDGNGNKQLNQAQKPIRRRCVELHDLYAKIPPGDFLQGELIYDVPFSAVKGAVLRLKDQWSDETVDIDLDVGYSYED